MNRKQFVLCKSKGRTPSFDHSISIGEYELYVNESADHCFRRIKNNEFHLLGSIFDYRETQLGNDDLLQGISNCENIEELISATNSFCGHFVFIAKFDQEIYLFHDATGQKEVFYDLKYQCLGSQPRLLKEGTDYSEHTEKEALDFFDSSQFKKKKLFPGTATHKKSIFHLLPNHYLNLSKKTCTRFFPSEQLPANEIDIVAETAASMLKGYITSMASRNKLKLAVTGGYDSRVLFLASLQTDCKYYVDRHVGMTDAHYDIDIPKQLAAHFGKEFSVEESGKKKKSDAFESYAKDLDFPRSTAVKTEDNCYTYINGNISEIARNYFGYHQNLGAEDLSFLAGFSTLPFAVKQYSTWLKNKPLFHKLGYSFLDLFYWEEKMGNWAAKSKTENAALGRDVISPFNSRNLLNLLLSSKRTLRDSHYNKLYDKMMEVLSHNDSFVTSLPINPDRRQNIIRLMKKFKIYDLYRYIGIKSRKLNP